MESVITATNRQTAIKQDQFFALKDFAKKVENYFKTFGPEERLFYERRAHQYDSLDIPKTRIMPHEALVRAVGGMFLSEPHITTRNYRQLSAKVGKEMFKEDDRVEVYYVAASALYKLESLFRAKKIEPKYKPARFHMLLAARLLVDRNPLPPWNSNEMERRCNVMAKEIWNKYEEIFFSAAEVVNEVVDGNFARDFIRTEPITNAILRKFGHKTKAAR